jgi:tRNA (mo5U34)-methyltransferase
VGFKGVRVGGVAVLIDIDDAVSGRLSRTLPWRRGRERAPSARERISSPSSSPPAHVADGSLEERVNSIEWYHTIDLGQGVITPGSFDHRPYVDHFGLPARLDGKRVLDVATFDGFWAFECEKRGAAEVVAIDLDRYSDVDLAPRVRQQLSGEQLNKPLGTGFTLAHEVLGSSVRRETLSVYDLSPERLGTFDVVFCSDLLLHLTSPVKALQNIRTVTTERAVIVDTFHALLPQNTVKYMGGAETSVWWHFSLGALERMIADAGFAHVELLRTFQMSYGGNRSLSQAVFNATP